MIRLLATLAVLLAVASGSAASSYAGNLASLLDPATLATLGPRGANPRIQKAVCWRAVA